MAGWIRGGALALVVALATGNVHAQTRPDLLFCGSSNRTGSDLYSGIGPLNEVTSCNPDANTQALLVVRNGSVAGNGAAWLDYLNNGGIIITEFQQPEAVYNELYGTSYLDDFSGNCQDNVLPSVILNPGDPFWGGSPPAPLGDSNLDSCGSDLQDIVDGEPAVVALGARDPEGTLSLAYRRQGDGLLILSGADWRDTNQYTDGSRALFGRLITASAGPAGPVEPIPALPGLVLAVLIALLAGLGLRGTVARRR